MFREFVIAKQRAEDKHDERMTMAWTIAALSNQKRLPRLETLLAQRNTGPQTVGQMRSMLQQLSTRLGIPLRKAHKSG